MTAPEELQIRPARPADAEDVWRWRNDAVSRSNSRQTDPVPWNTHEGWFGRALSDPGKVLLIGEAGEKVGLVRFDLLESGERLVGVNVEPRMRGQGWGARLLAAALERLGDRPLLAEVRTDNTPSIRLFESLGFRRREESDGFILYERPLPE